MHADEAMQAARLGTLLEKHSAEYDPAEHHGPALAYFTLPAAWLSRQWRFADLNEWTIRLTPVLAGLGLVVVSLVLGNKAGRGSGAIAALFTAVSPILVYYSRCYIPEMLLTHLGTLKFAEACPKRVLSDAQRHSIVFPAKNLVEPTGFEPVTSSMPLRRSTN